MILLEEGAGRGFLSNYLTILLAFRELIEKRGVPPGEIFVSSSMFSLYGDPSNWFAPEKVRSAAEAGPCERLDTMKLWYQLNGLADFRPGLYGELAACRKYFGYNPGTAAWLARSARTPDNCLGLHFRGTDNNYGKAPAGHAAPAGLPVFLARVSRELETGRYENLFVATDEEGVVEKVREYCLLKHRFDKIHSNAVTRSADGAALHFSRLGPPARVKLGYEVLLDAHCLAGCAAVICKASNIAGYLLALDEKAALLRVDLPPA